MERKNPEYYTFCTNGKVERYREDQITKVIFDGAALHYVPATKTYYIPEGNITVVTK